MRTARTVPRALILMGAAMALMAPARAATAEPAEPTVAELQQRIRQSSAELERVVDRYHVLNAELARSRAEATRAGAELVATQARLDGAAAEVGALAVDAYKVGELSTLGVLLDSGSSGALLDRATALDQVARYRTAEVGRMTRTRADVARHKQTVDRLVATQTAQRATLAATKQKIEKDLDSLYAMRERAYGAKAETPPAVTAPAPKPPPLAGRAATVVAFAYAALGKPYVWAASGPNGYDCSGLVLAAWGKVGVRLTHASSVQYRETTRISRAQLQPGDLVFYNDLGHVAIYVGDGKVIHAPTFGEVVKISQVDMLPPDGYGRPG